jgi:hypothetical protein
MKPGAFKLYGSNCIRMGVSVLWLKGRGLESALNPKPLHELVHNPTLSRMMPFTSTVSSSFPPTLL